VKEDENKISNEMKILSKWEVSVKWQESKVTLENFKKMQELSDPENGSKLNYNKS